MEKSHEYLDLWDNELGIPSISCESDLYPIIFKSRYFEYDWSKINITLLKERFRSFKKGVAIVTGKIGRYHRNYRSEFLVCIDIANKMGLEEILSIFKIDTLEELARMTLVENYVENEVNKYHVFIISETPLYRRHSLKVKSDKHKDDVPAIEVKSDATTFVFVTPSINNNGQPYQIIGTRKPIYLDKGESLELEKSLNFMNRKYIFNKYSIIGKHKPSDYILSSST